MSEISESRKRARAEGDCQNWPDRELSVFETLFFDIFPKRRVGMSKPEYTKMLMYWLASEVHSILRTTLVCTAPKCTWYRFDTHCWGQLDSPDNYIKKAINKMRSEIRNLQHDELSRLTADPQTDEEKEHNKGVNIRYMCAVDTLLMLGNEENGGRRNDIIAKAKKLFFDSSFLGKLDANKKLLCCSNGVIDFEQGNFRPGQPDDYLSKSLPLTMKNCLIDAEWTG